MDRDREGMPGPVLPFLLRFKRPQPACDLEYYYDEAQRLNLVSRDDGIVAFMATARGRRALKTTARGSPPED